MCWEAGVFRNICTTPPQSSLKEKLSPQDTRPLSAEAQQNYIMKDY
jgi:hypothetical protein